MQQVACRLMLSYVLDCVCVYVCVADFTNKMTKGKHFTIGIKQKVFYVLSIGINSTLAHSEGQKLNIQVHLE